MMYVSLALALLLSAVLFYLRARNKNGAPGPTKLPFWGSLIRFDPKKIHKRFQSLALEYGPIMSLQFGNVQAVVLSDAKSIQEALLSSKAKSFNGRLNGPIQQVYCGVYKIEKSENELLGGIGVSQGDIWRVNRKLAVSKLLSKHHLIDMEGDILSESVGLTDALHGALSANKAKGELTIDPSAALRAVSLNMTTRVCFQRKFHEISAEFFEQSAEEGGDKEEADNFSYAEFYAREGFPWPKSDETAHQFLQYQESIGFLRGILQDILDEHKQDSSIRTELSFVDSIIHAQSIDDMDQSDTSAVSLMLDLMLAGSDSVSKSLAFTVLLLSRHRNVQERLADELASQGQMDLSQLDDLQYLDAVILEALRLFPVAPLALPHVCTADETIGNFSIKRGVVVVPNIWALHRDPKVWDRPDDFVPERFLMDPSLKTSPNFAPFGIGARNCVGKYLGMAQMKAVIGNLFQQFQITTTSGVSDSDIDDGTVGLAGLESGFLFITC